MTNALVADGERYAGRGVHAAPRPLADGAALRDVLVAPHRRKARRARLGLASLNRSCDARTATNRAPFVGSTTMAEADHRDLDPDTAPVNELNRELARLQRQYRVASHEVGERDVRPDDIDDATLAWWVAAHRAMWRRPFELSDTASNAKTVDQVELRKTRLRKPTR